MTRLNVYAGPAGFYLVRGGSEDLNLGYNRPGPNLFEGVNPSDIITEIPIAVQDRSFNQDGSLFYPDTRAFFDGYAGPFIPDTDIAPIWNPEFFGNTIVVNGQTWPYFEVQQRRYRFRILNGCNSRVLILRFDDSLLPNSLPVWQIGNEGGFLPDPIDVSTLVPDGVQGGILLGLAERADLIVDFSDVPVGTSFKLLNLGPDEPFGGGEAGVDFPVADPDSTGQIMEFRVVAGAPATDPGADPATLSLPAIPALGGGGTTPLALLEMMSEVHDGPAEAMLGTMSGGVPTHKMWMNPITENPKAGETQVWEFYNFTADAHPIHIHEIHFQVVDRQPLVTDPDTGEVVIPVSLAGAARPPEAWEEGSFKDTVLAYPGEVTRVRARFKIPGLFVWHCHIVEHEDNEMMRPYFIGGALSKLPYHLYIRKLGRMLF
jgi:FtsP/CotA-like multicopper oxidase with cupredoxin domain